MGHVSDLIQALVLSQDQPHRTEGAATDQCGCPSTATKRLARSRRHPGAARPAVDTEGSLNLSVHSQVLYLPEPGAPCGERFEVRLDVDGALVLPATSGHVHDVHLWTSTPGFQWRTEVWLHGVHFTPAQRGAQGGEGWAEVSGTGRGRPLHRVAETDVPRRPGRAAQTWSWPR